MWNSSGWDVVVLSEKRLQVGIWWIHLAKDRKTKREHFIKATENVRRERHDKNKAIRKFSEQHEVTDCSYLILPLLEGSQSFWKLARSFVRFPLKARPSTFLFLSNKRTSPVPSDCYSAGLFSHLHRANLPATPRCENMVVCFREPSSSIFITVGKLRLVLTPCAPDA